MREEIRGMRLDSLMVTTFELRVLCSLKGLRKVDLKRYMVEKYLLEKDIEKWRYKNEKEPRIQKGDRRKRTHGKWHDYSRCGRCLIEGSLCDY